MHVINSPLRWLAGGLLDMTPNSWDMWYSKWMRPRATCYGLSVGRASCKSLGLAAWGPFLPGLFNDSMMSQNEITSWICIYFPQPPSCTSSSATLTFNQILLLFLCFRSASRGEQMSIGDSIPTFPSRCTILPTLLLTLGWDLAGRALRLQTIWCKDEAPSRYTSNDAWFFIKICPWQNQLPGHSS